MNAATELSELLSQFLYRSGYSLGQLSWLTGVAKRTIANWVNGRVQKPHNPDGLLRLAAALHLDAAETTQLLQSAGYPSIEEFLQGELPAGLERLLAPWAELVEKQRQSAPFQVIVDTPYFVGREQELQAIKETLLRGDRVMVCSLQGMGGVGKTALAAHVAYELRFHFPDGVLWARVDISHTMTILSTFANAYGRDVSRYSDLDSRSRVVRELLAGKRALMVLDNAGSSREIEPLLPPTTGTCAVIITTRRQDLFAVVGAHRFEVGPFSQEKEEALDLFACLLDSEKVIRERATLAEIAQVLGHLPLAVAIAASRLAYEPGWSAAEFLERICLQKRRLDELSYENNSVRLSAGLSYRRLQLEQQRFFTALGVFRSENLNVEAVAYVTGLPLVETLDGLRQLHNLSLVQSGQSGFYRLHPLLRDFAWEQLECAEDWQEILTRMVQFFVGHVESYERDYGELEGEVDNILGALETAYTQTWDEFLVRGVLAFCHFLKARGLYNLAITHLERARQAAGRLDDKSRLATILFYLGHLPRRRGDLRQAEPYLREGLALAQELGDEKLISMLLADLSVVDLFKGEPRERTDAALQQGLALARDLGDKELISMLLTYIGVQAARDGHTTEAEKCYQEGLALAQEAGDWERSAVFMNNLGALAIDQESYSQGEVYCQEGLTLARQIGLQALTAAALCNLGEIAQARQVYRRAERHYRESLAIARGMEYHELLIELLDNLGQLAASQRDYRQAELFYQEGLALARQQGRIGDASTLLLRLGALTIACGQWEQTEIYYQESLALVHSLKQGRGLRTLLNEWGELYLGQQALKMARAAFQASAKIAREQGDPTQAGQAGYGLARVAAAQDDFDEARRRGQASLEALELAEHAQAAEVSRWLAELPCKNGRLT